MKIKIKLDWSRINNARHADVYQQKTRLKIRRVFCIMPGLLARQK
jgi:hypothetical protein